MPFLFSLFFGRFAIAILTSLGLLYFGPCNPKKTVELEVEVQEYKEAADTWRKRALHAEMYIETYCGKKVINEKADNCRDDRPPGRWVFWRR